MEKTHEKTQTTNQKTPRTINAEANIKKKLYLAGIIVILIVAAVIFSLPFIKLAGAKKLTENGDYDNAMTVASKVISTPGAFAQFSKAATAKGDTYLNDGDEINAAIYYLKAGRPIESEQIFDFNSIVMGYSYVTAGISLNGDSYYITNREGDSQVAGLEMVAGMKNFLPATAGINGVDYLGSPIFHPLDKTGKIYLSGTVMDELKAEDHIVYAISDTRPADGHSYVVTLKKDGAVKVFSDTEKPLSDIEKWKKIRTITDGGNKIFGLDFSGKLHIAYENPEEKEKIYDISTFPALQKVVETGKAVIGLTVSGGLCVAYADTEIRYDFDFASVKNATDIAANNNILVITFGDGSVKALRIPNWISDNKDAKLKKTDSVIRTVNRWKKIVRVRFAANGIYGIGYDGKVRFTSCDIKYNTNKNKYEFNSQKNVSKLVSQWTDIVDVISCTTHAVAIKYDGTAVSTGNTEYLIKKYTTPSSETYSYVKRTDGTYSDVSSWQLW